MSLKETRRGYSEGNFQSLEASESLAQPAVIYDESLFSPEVPYTVTVDAARCGTLFREFGMSDDRIKELTIVAKRKDPGVKGRWDSKNKNVIVATDWLWDTYEGCLALADKTARQNRRPIRDKFKRLLRTKNTKRLYEYLTIAPPERGVTFADRLFSEGMNREVNALFLHEAKHALDSSDRILSLKSWLTFTGMFTSSGVSFYLINRQAILAHEIPEQVRNIFDLFPNYDLIPTFAAIGLSVSIGVAIRPKERSAKKFERQHKHDPKWHNLVTIKPKELK